jgi:hypothetical protein
MMIIRRTLSSASDRRIEARYASTYTHQSHSHIPLVCAHRYHRRHHYHHVLFIIIVVVPTCYLAMHYRLTFCGASHNRACFVFRVCALMTMMMAGG